MTGYEYSVYMYLIKIHGETGNEYFELVLNGQTVGYFTSLEALGVAIESIKVLIQGYDLLEAA